MLIGGRNGTSRSVPRLVRLKTVERVAPWDEIWLIFRSTSSPWNDPFHIRGTQIYNILWQNFSLYFLIFTSSVPSRPVLFRPVCVPNSTLGCVWYADGTGRNGTRRDGTRRDGTGRNEGVIFEKYMGVFYRRGTNPFQGGGGTQKHPKYVPWNSPFHPFLAYQTRDGTPRPVPSRPVPRTKRTLRENLYHEAFWELTDFGVHRNSEVKQVAHESTPMMGDPLRSSRVSSHKQNREGVVGAQSRQYRATAVERARDMVDPGSGCDKNRKNSDDQPLLPPPSRVLSSTEAPNDPPPVPALSGALPTTETSPKQPL
ncbi:hypothetical protein DVH24_038991 [Malus domestica]|uniref:Uncharacterized protein n=1 Tax=Malus domestica TaxID=3750 RepID=A0A498KBI4_MALDO|nr:hypothetical protein DVH24_038991 [Malus domestica]